MLCRMLPDVESFIRRWQGVSGGERSNYQLFLLDLAALLELPLPEPAVGDPALDAYWFERPVRFRHGDGSESQGFIGLYRRGSLERG